MVARSLITFFSLRRYKTRDDFSADVQLMFVNCVTFNGDDSPVGKAGHSIKTFFYSRWAEMIAH
jgi:hypothetical protein